jgi:predicted amidophosphoribosyltransferase
VGRRIEEGQQVVITSEHVHCGEPVQAACSHCGAQLHSSFSYCPYCGNRI